MKFVRTYPRTASLLLALALFTLGYYRQTIIENKRMRSLVESAMQADHDIQNLVFAYQLRLGTVRSLAQYALKRNIEVPHDVRSALDEDGSRPDTANLNALRSYLLEQIRLTTAAKELITQMDVDLPPTDPEFGKLLSQFQAEEDSLTRLRESYDQQTRLARTSR